LFDHALDECSEVNPVFANVGLVERDDTVRRRSSTPHLDTGGEADPISAPSGRREAGNAYDGHVGIARRSITCRVVMAFSPG
jgi:hypothetical protein